MSQDRIRASKKVKLFVKTQSLKMGLSEGEILELELFGTLSKKT